MALRLNLYHEIDKEALARRRDPFKLASYAGALVVVLLIAFYFYRSGQVSTIKADTAQLTKEWAKLKVASDAAKAREEELLKQKAANKALIDRLQGRFYWAPFIQQLGEIIPPNIQITSFSSNLSPNKTMVCLFSGLAAGIEPRGEAELFRSSTEQKLSKIYSKVSVKFDLNSLEDSTQMVILDGKTLAAVTFRIRAEFSVEPPTPAAPAAQATIAR
jgi:hypothetical protein